MVGVGSTGRSDSIRTRVAHRDEVPRTGWDCALNAEEQDTDRLRSSPTRHDSTFGSHGTIGPVQLSSKHRTGKNPYANSAFSLQNVARRVKLEGYSNYRTGRLVRKQNRR